MRFDLPTVSKLMDGLLYLAFPSLCAACDRAISDRRQIFCISCLRHLEDSRMYMQEENIFTDRMFGKAYIKTGAALYLFTKGGPIQKIIHKLKYKNRPDLGVHCGIELGKALLKSEYYTDLDLIIPVPLHPRKERERGYNQSEKIADGISETLLLKQELNVLVRKTYTGSQTQMGRLDRYANVHEVYSIQKASKIAGKHILLVDDVLTTGATLGACTDLLLRAGAAKVSAVTIAIAV